MSKLLCIYHGHCDDGFAAAWCVRHAIGEDRVEFYPGVYQQPPPDVTDRHVLLVDFSYKRPVLLEMAEKAKSIVILDHHKTAADDLSGLGEPATYEKWGAQRLAALFDMSRSGAGLAWDFFHPGRERPGFVDYIEDRDLWRKLLPDGDEFTIALRSYPQDFLTWSQFFFESPERLIREGRGIQRYYRLRVEELKRSAYMATINFDGGLAGSLDARVCVANAPYFAASEVAGELAERADVAFGACYFEVSGGRWQYSLRSRGDFDVSDVARCYGGGGHKNAAGFTVDAPVHRKL